MDGDLFEFLDMDLMEVFIRNHAENEHQLEYVQRAHHDFQPRWRRHNQPAFRVVRKFGVPLVSVDVWLLWARYRPRDVRRRINRAMAVVGLHLVTLLRGIMFLYLFERQVRSLLTAMLEILNLHLFSENVMYDVLTYLFHDNTNMVERRIHPKFENLDESAGEWVQMKTLALDYIASHIRLNETVPNNSSLLFRFGEVIRDYRPGYEGSQVKTFAMLFFVLYLVVVNITALNLALMFGLNSVKRSATFAKPFHDVAMAIWSELF